MSSVLDTIIGKPGRKKIVYNPADLERPPVLVVVVGMKEVGKTYKTVQDIGNYTKPNLKTGKPARKALILDFNNEASYQQYKPVSTKYIRALTEPRARRIMSIDEHGRKFDLEMMRKVAEYVVNNYLNGLIILEDIDKYMTGKKGQSLIGAMVTNRHSGLDLQITHQSAAKVSKTEWENAAWVRLHHQLDDMKRIKDELPNYPLMKIAQLIVDKKYYATYQAYNRGEFDEDELKKRRSFYVLINMVEHKILRATLEEFNDAAMQFIRIHPGMITTRMKIGDPITGKALSREEAMKSLLSDYALFFQAA